MAPATARSALVVGEIVVTPAVGRLIVQGALDPVPYLRRHLAGDWGELTETDRRDNENTLLEGGEIFSSYATSPTQTLWIVSEWDFSVTTLLLPTTSDLNPAA
ncbi:TPA: plasmid related protein [Pseudomonas aeruginosa]|uniref:hypothetical protein n=1 Tax=Pseudomonas aeruginosa group TaxID=136841 RepID=UPI0012D9C989|nr:MULTISPECIES: hypothetical protein [Pseudomonas aeruginosa group]MBH9459188.1 plasmid related protein [Pseudomonas aeruginosa]MBH9465971.1 plasmid related protein [Pseudomonas aeruginosa]MUI47056.1 hypothetical protein [Pseudomonas aeruginosa]QPZ62085.1 plasmid related protein [Pseudomonas aeruginosa]HCF0987683.1 plasmid related protein [Pseudomonas aeruginosa]